MRASGGPPPPLSRGRRQSITVLAMLLSIRAMPSHSQTSSPPDLIRWSMLSCGQAVPVEALHKRDLSMDAGIGERSDAVLRTAMPGHDGRTERTGRTKKIRRRNADRRNGQLGRACGPGRAPIGVRTSIGVPPRLWLRRPNATTQLQFRASLTGARKRALPANRPAAVQRCFSQTGRSAGRADFPKLPECGLQVRPRVPPSPRTRACRP